MQIATTPSSALLDRLASLRKSGDKKALGKLQADMVSALTAELVDTVGPGIEGWTTPHVEKASFPYQVDRQRAKYAPIARAQLNNNIRASSALLTNPAIAAAVLLGVETRLDAASHPQPQDLSNPEFKRFYDDLRTASRQSGNYAFYGTLVNVGWGSGDHVNVTSDSLPAGPKTTSGRLANAVMSEMVQEKSPPVPVQV